MDLKQKVHQAFVQLQAEKISQLKASISDLQESAANETKSTAGDKHETALAHLQTAIRQAGQQLQELNNQYNLLTSIDPTIITKYITAGSLVITNKNILYISAAIGKVLVDEKTVIAISQSSPLGMKLNGKKEKDTVLVNELVYEIISVS
jgi:transcription elongation GreA/GreB family factor